MFKVLLDHLISDVSGTPCSITYGPEVFSPVTFWEIRKFFLEFSGCGSFEFLSKIRDWETWWILNVHMDMIFAYDPRKDSYILCITDLHDQFSTTRLDFSLQHTVTIFRYPYDVYGKSRERVRAMSVKVSKGEIHRSYVWYACHILSTIPPPSTPVLKQPN